MKVQDIMTAIEALAPTSLKEDWDNVGLQIGHPQDEVTRVLLALTLSQRVIDEAIALKADMIVTHHPFLFKGVKTLRSDRVEGRFLHQCIKHDIAYYCAHTNLDIAQGGVNDCLAACLGLENVQGLSVSASAPTFKVVTFVPTAAAEQVKQAMFEAGAGSQGDYDSCAWETTGMGQFRPLDGAHPAIGQLGEVEQVEEKRIEVLVDAKKLSAVLNAMQQAHPYEEVAFDVLTNNGRSDKNYIGRIGQLAVPRPLGEWLDDVATVLDMPVLSYCGDKNRMITTVALCGGSAIGYMDEAKALGADVYITGDMKYHDGQHAEEIDMAVIDVSHYAGERPVLKTLAKLLEDKVGGSLEVIISEKEQSFIQYFKK